MTPIVHVYDALMARLVWLDLGFALPVDAALTSALLQRLTAYLAGSELMPMLVHGRVLVVSVGPALTRLDRSLLIAWLIEQPEVARVAFVRPHGNGTLVVMEGRQHA